MKIAVVSLGCPKNQVDADVMCHSLLKQGHTTTGNPDEADVVLVNTCAFIESAKQEAIDNILAACEMKNDHPNLKVVVTGCLAERYREQIRAEIPEVDAVVGMAGNKDIAAVLEHLTEGPAELFGPKDAMPLGGSRIISTPSHYAYLKIAEGCSNGCYYCAIPHIRGGLRSRPLEDCVKEAKWLAEEGVKELIVVAQDITAYGSDWGEIRLCELLRQLNGIEGLRWIRLMYAYPERITDELIETMASCEKIVPYLDMPIQHCSDEVLKRMNRKSDHAVIVNAIERLRKGVPGITLRTSLIAGFPGETEEQFEELLQFMKDVGFDRLGCFAYSAEEDTLAATMPDQIDETVKQQRADRVMQAQANIMAQKQAARVGKTLQVICDDYDEESGRYVCRTPSDAPEIDGVVYVAANRWVKPGEIVEVTVTDSDVYDLYGELVSK